MKVIVFIDYWNLQLTIQQQDAKSVGKNANSHRFNIDWYSIGRVFTDIAQSVVSGSGLQEKLCYQETRIYTSDNPDSNGKYRRWVNNSLSKQPSIRAYCLDRKVKKQQECPYCNRVISNCPHCDKEFKSTQEKGVDTLLVTDLLNLGLNKAYDIAVLASQDSDMKPAVKHLSDNGIKVIHAGIKNFGNDLSGECWAKFDLFPKRDQIKRR
ncbi:MAG: NYN domain-containing protein [Thermodesulfobacteriota bacterium]